MELFLKTKKWEVISISFKKSLSSSVFSDYKANIWLKIATSMLILINPFFLQTLM